MRPREQSRGQDDLFRARLDQIIDMRHELVRLSEQKRGVAQRTLRIPAGEIEGLVLDRLRGFVTSRFEVSGAVAPLEIDTRALDAVLRGSSEAAECDGRLRHLLN